MPKQKLPGPLVGMAGVFYACYELSRRGWYCLPTIRNTAGIDIVAYSLDGNRRITIQVKSLSKRSAVPMRKTKIPYDFLIIVRKIVTDKPEIFILTRDEAESLITETRGRKGEIQYWLEIRDYEKFKDRWDVIGPGYDEENQ